MKESNDIVNQFIIETVLISPIDKIIKQLKKNDFRDCDIKFLDKKLEIYFSFACESLGLSNIILQSDIGYESFTILNEYNTKKYIKWFSALLEYFKSF